MAAYISGFGSFCVYLAFFKNPFTLQRYTIEASKGQTVVKHGKTGTFFVEDTTRIARLAAQYSERALFTLSRGFFQFSNQNYLSE